MHFEEMVIMDEHLNDLCTFLSTVRDRVLLRRCELYLKLDKIPHRISHSKLELLHIYECELNINWIKRFLGLSNLLQKSYEFLSYKLFKQFDKVH